MSSTAQSGGAATATRLGFKAGQIVQELGWDDDVDDELRASIEEVVGSEMVEEAMEAVDVVVLWWRDSDGDLLDGLLDAVTDLTDDGYLWLLTPKVGREGFVDATDLSEAAGTAGLAQTNTAPLSSDWTASKLVPPKGSRR